MSNSTSNHSYSIGLPNYGLSFTPFSTLSTTRKTFAYAIARVTTDRIHTNLFCYLVFYCCGSTTGAMIPMRRRIPSAFCCVLILHAYDNRSRNALRPQDCSLFTLVLGVLGKYTRGSLAGVCWWALGMGLSGIVIVIFDARSGPSLWHLFSGLCFSCY